MTTASIAEAASRATGEVAPPVAGINATVIFPPAFSSLLEAFEAASAAERTLRADFDAKEDAGQAAGIVGVMPRSEAAEAAGDLMEEAQDQMHDAYAAVLRFPTSDMSVVARKRAIAVEYCGENMVPADDWFAIIDAMAAASGTDRAAWQSAVDAMNDANAAYQAASDALRAAEKAVDAEVPVPEILKRRFPLHGHYASRKEIQDSGALTFEGKVNAIAAFEDFQARRIEAEARHGIDTDDEDPNGELWDAYSAARDRVYDTPAPDLTGLTTKMATFLEHLLLGDIGETADDPVSISKLLTSNSLDENVPGLLFVDMLRLSGRGGEPAALAKPFDAAAWLDAWEVLAKPYVSFENIPLIMFEGDALVYAEKVPRDAPPVIAYNALAKWQRTYVRELGAERERERREAKRLTPSEIAPDMTAEAWIAKFKADGGTFHTLPADPGTVWIGQKFHSTATLNDLHAVLKGDLRTAVLEIAKAEIAARGPDDVVEIPEIYLNPRTVAR